MNRYTLFVKVLAGAIVLTGCANKNDRLMESDRYEKLTARDKFFSIYGENPAYKKVLIDCLKKKEPIPNSIEEEDKAIQQCRKLILDRTIDVLLTKELNKCLDTSAKRLDDHISPPIDIARKAMSLCDKQFREFLQFHETLVTSKPAKDLSERLIGGQAEIIKKGRGDRN